MNGVIVTIVHTGGHQRLSEGGIIGKGLRDAVCCAVVYGIHILVAAARRLAAVVWQNAD